MEEGRRMFHIFAARMFEQRVLAAYREKVARERQQKLLEEIEEEERRAEEKSSKKSKEKERKKEKQRLLKQQKEEERLKKEEEKAAEEAARRQEEEKKAEEARRKKEEARLRKDAERKQQELERLKKEEERRKRQAEERERQLEIERKKREKDEAAKKRREEAIKREREAKEAKERDAKEKKEREERERRERATPKPPVGAKRQGTPVSPTRLAASQPAIPKVPTPTPSRSSIPPTATTPPHPPFANGSSSSTPETSNHTPSPRVASAAALPLHSAQPVSQSTHFHVPIQPLPGSGFTSPSLRNQFPSIPESLGPSTHPNIIGASPLQQARPPTGAPPVVNGHPLGIYGPSSIGNPGPFGRFPPAPHQQPGFSPVGPPAMPHNLSRGYAESIPPATPTYPSPIGSMPSHGSPILPPPQKPSESGMSSPQVSHSRKASIDALTDLTASLSTRQYPPGINGSAPLPPPGLGRTIQRPAPIQRPQSTASSGRGSGFFQDEEMGVGSRALLDEGLEGEDEIIQPSAGGMTGFGPSRRPSAFPSLGDKLWSTPSSSTVDTMWGQDKNAFLWGNAGASSNTEDHPFPSWDSRPSFPQSNSVVLQERIRDVCSRIDPQGFVPIETVVAQLQRNYPLDRVVSDEVLRTAQSSPASLQVVVRNGTWAIRAINQTDSRPPAGARMIPGTPPNDLGRNMLGSLAEVVRGLD